MAVTDWRNPSLPMTESVARAAEQARGLPPKVEPWEPGLKAVATLAVVRQAPMGMPEANALAEVMMSGVMPLC